MTQESPATEPTEESVEGFRQTGDASGRSTYQNYFR